MDQTVQSVMDSFRRIVRALRKASRSTENGYGLRTAQFFVLQQLKTFQPLSVNELAEKTFSHQSTVSVVVDELVKMELVERNISTQDRRKMVLKVTGKGESLIKKRKISIQEKFAHALNSMPTDQGEKLAELLEIFIKNAGLDKESPQFFFENEQQD